MSLFFVGFLLIRRFDLFHEFFRARGLLQDVKAWIVVGLGADLVRDPLEDCQHLGVFLFGQQIDLQINLLTEQENTKMLTILKRIADKVGAKTDDDPSLHVLEQATRPEKLVEQIEAANKQKSDEK